MDAGLHQYAHAWIPWERASMRVVMMGFIAFSFHQFKRDLDLRSRKVRQLEGILPVCPACNRISDSQGHWTDLEVYLRQNSEAGPRPGFARIAPAFASGKIALAASRRLLPYLFDEYPRVSGQALFEKFGVPVPKGPRRPRPRTLSPPCRACPTAPRW